MNYIAILKSDTVVNAMKESASPAIFATIPKVYSHLITSL
jgi:hypothetical protein